jgi:L-malate glycosyltransferase
MRVLIATNSYPTEKNPTHQVFVKNIYDGLNSRDVKVDVVYNPFFRLFKSDLKTGTIITSILKFIFLFCAYLPFILYKAKKYDLIYSHATVLPGFFMLAAQRLHGIKHVCYVHGSVNSYVKQRGILFRIARYTLYNCSNVVTNSRYMQKRLKNEYGCSANIITPGYNNSVYKYRKTDREIDLFFAGSAIQRKGIGLILDVINTNRKFYEKNNLLIKMNFSGGNRDDYIRYAKSNNIDSLIRFGERLTEEELVTAYQHSKVVLFPSSEEPLGLVGIEAIACGAIVVGSDSGGISEFLIHEKNGYLFEENDIDDLQNHIEKAIKKFPDFEKKQPSVSNSVKHFSIEHGINQTLSFFKDILKN